MIITLLKHKLFELSIDKLFKTINSNFKNVPDISVGSKFRSITVDTYDVISHKYIKKTYTTCEIKHVYTANYLNSKMTIFNFTTSSGDLIMGCDVDSIIFDR